MRRCAIARSPHCVLVAMATLLAPVAAHAADPWPSRPLRMVIPFAPGGTTDLIGRMVAEGLSRALGQPVVVENKAGAGGNLGAADVARAPPDGYTLMMGTPGPLAINRFVYCQHAVSTPTRISRRCRTWPTCPT